MISIQRGGGGRYFPSVWFLLNHAPSTVLRGLGGKVLFCSCLQGAYGAGAGWRSGTKLVGWVRQFSAQGRAKISHMWDPVAMGFFSRDRSQLQPDSDMDPLEHACSHVAKTG